MRSRLTMKRASPYPWLYCQGRPVYLWQDAAGVYWLARGRWSKRVQRKHGAGRYLESVRFEVWGL